MHLQQPKEDTQKKNTETLEKIICDATSSHAERQLYKCFPAPTCIADDGRPPAIMHIQCHARKSMKRKELDKKVRPV